jgi:hypothetical protein
MKSFFLVCILSGLCFAQQPQPTVQQQITVQVSQLANVITTLNQIPALVDQITALQAQVKDLQEKLNKKETKK